MASYDLNQVLKDREASQSGQQNSEMHLDDVSRVKVLSPGMKVFKRFIRNRLAVFGTILLAIMFIFSFFGPLFYAYGQKQIFYKYDVQNVNYAMAKENTAYNGYDADASLNPERSVVNAMNSNIKKMIAAGQDTQIVYGESGAYRIRKLGTDIYTLDVVELTSVCTIGKGTVKVGVYDAIRKNIDFTGAQVPGLAEAAKAVKGTGGTVEHEGVSYTFKKSAGKSYDITAEMDGLVYTGEEMDADFEKAAAAAAESGEGFSYQGSEYVVSRSGSMSEISRLGQAQTAKVFTRLTADTYEVGQKISNDFRVGALLAAYSGGSFEADGARWQVEAENGSLIILTADGDEYAEFTPFSVRRYDGADTMEYRLKKAVAGTVEEMLSAGVKIGTLVFDLPQQNEVGEYRYDEDGNLLYQETELKISQRDTGEYIINCDQVNYIIDRFAAPSAKHILGTDGDGFDVLARIMYGGRVSLMVGFVVVFLEIFLGIIMGGLAGYYGGWVDNLIMRLVDIFYCLPSMPIMIILGAMMDALRMNTYLRLMIMMAALGVMGWASVARLVRGQILSLREQEFMVAAEATGIRVKDRIFRHLIPNVMPQLIVTATMGIGSVILMESTLSFLGLGVKHPLATWGTIINSVSSASAMAHYAFIWIPVGLLICLTVIAFNFVGDGLRDAYDPRAKR